MDKYGCHNKPREDGYWVRDGCEQTLDNAGVVEVQRLRWHADTMSRECRYDERSRDLRCEGCERK